MARPYGLGKMATRVMPAFERLETVAWRSHPLTALKSTENEMVTRFGEPALRDEDSNGWGLFDCWAVRFPCGLEVSLWLMQTREGSDVTVTDPNEDRWLNVYANQKLDRDHLRFHLALRTRELSPWMPDPTFDGPREHVIMRQDDNGNVVEVTRCTSACEAEGRRDALEAAGHRQLYWTVKDASAAAGGQKLSLGR